MATATKPVLKSKDYYLTQKGLENLRAELEFLKKDKRTELARRLQEAREFENTEENAEYDAAMQEQEVVESRIFELEKILHNAKVIQLKSVPGETVTIGSTVVMKFDGDLDEFTIVGRMEANPSKKKVSDESPIGKALIGARKGETIEIVTPSSKYSAKIIEIK